MCGIHRSQGTAELCEYSLNNLIFHNYLDIIFLHVLMIFVSRDFISSVGGAWANLRERITHAYSYYHHTIADYLHR